MIIAADAELTDNICEEFKLWMKKQKKANGEDYSPNTIDAYASQLKNATAKLNLGSAVNTDLFTYTSFDEFEKACQLIVAASNFKEVDSAAGNKAYSNGIKLYGKFLKERDKGGGTYTESDFLTEVYISAEQYATLKGLLHRKKNLILQGAPGVGKTFAARRLAFSIMGEKDTSRVKTVQFHQSSSYEDFVMGYRPDGQGFRLVHGPFYEFCKRAKEDEERDYFFIIDEINRGNLSKIFGELLMLIEDDKRGEQHAIRLLYENELFSVPANVHIIGMMNTADRSLAMIDYALRRRFAFFDMEPAFESDGFKLQGKIQNEKFHTLVEAVKALNAEIATDESLGIGFRIGHSYFCLNATVDDDGLSSIVNYELVPLLNEYWFDEPSKAQAGADRLRGALGGK